MFSKHAVLSEVAALPVHPRIHEVATTLHFDEYYELLWAGTKSGGLYVYECPTLASYSWFRGHTKKVEAIKNVRHGAVSISSNCIRVHTHGGQSKLIHHDLEGNLKCMVVDPTHGGLQGKNRLILGRESGIVSQFDLRTSQHMNWGKLADRSICALETVVPGMVACGISDGKIVLVDPRNGLKAQHQVLGHRGGIVDIASKHNLLVSCGYEMHAGSLIVDTFIKVYDARSLREKLASVVFPAGPSYLRFHPKFSSTLVIASTVDVIGMQEIQADSIPITVQVNTDNSGLLSFGISSSGDLIGMGGGRGMLRLQASSRHATVNLVSAPHTRPQTNTPSSLRLKENDPFYLALQHSSLTGTLLSDWDPSTIIDVGRPPRVIKERGVRNINQLCSSSILDHNIAARLWNASNSRIEPLVVNQDSTMHFDSRSPSPMKIDIPCRLPEMYHPVEIKRSEARRFEEFDFGQYNLTERFSGLENSIPNSYCNALLQALFFHPAFRKAVLERQPNPLQEISLLDEMTFLFRMLGEGPAPPCQASNFLRALYHTQEAGALGLLVDANDRKSRSLPEKICHLYRFIMEKLNREWKKNSVAKDGLAPNCLESIFSIKSNVYTKCLNGDKCEKMQSMTSFLVDLPCLDELQDACASVRFCDVLAASLQSDCVLQAWFDEIRGDQHVRQTRISSEIGKVLVVNCSSSDCMDPAKCTGGMDGSRSPWIPSMLCIKQLVQTGELVLTEGETLERLGLSDQELSLVNSEQMSNVAVFELTGMVANIRDEQRNETLDSLITHVKVLPQYFRRHQGLRKLVEDIPSPTIFPFQEARLMEKNLCDHGRSAFSLEATEDSMVVEDSNRAVAVTGAQDSGSSGECSSLDSPKSSCASGPDPSGKNQWLLINDFSLQFTSLEEVQNLHEGKKSPCILFYTRRSELRSALNDQQVELMPALDHREFCELCRSRPLQGLNAGGTYIPVFKALEYETEVPSPGTLFALDAEFVVQGPANGVGLADNRRDGSTRMILGRVSVVRGEGPMAGVCCIDDYVRPLETVQDYLTRFSGLVDGDLDVSTSQRYLTTLKHVYVKLRYLVDCGCVFVGHGLKMDFRIINIVVPSNQIVDTVELFHLKRQRMLSLRFLASYLLGINIQSSTHDSIEDARTALQLYEIYNKLVQEGTFDTQLREMYNWGNQYGWDPGFWSMRPGEMHETSYHFRSAFP